MTREAHTVELPKIPRERIQAQLQWISPRMGSQAQSSQPGPAMRLEIVQGTGNAKSASQPEEWDWRSWKKSKKGKKRRKSERDLLFSGTESSSSSSESSSEKRKEEGTEEAKGKESQEKQEIRKTQPVEVQVTSR